MVIEAECPEAAADFGEAALDEVIATVNTDENKAAFALVIIEQMLERTSVRQPLSPRAHARIAEGSTREPTLA